MTTEITEKNGWIKAQGRRWDPSEGESLQGVYVKTERIKSKDPKKKDLLRYIIKNQESVNITVFGTTILDDLFQDVPIGAEVYIKFTGLSQNKPPLSPTKLFDVFYRPKEYKEGFSPASSGNGPTLNSHDPAEIGVFIQGVEEDLKGQGEPITELSMLTEARAQITGDEKFWKLVKKEITGRYPPKSG
jgi:hypothetical protein